MIPGQGAYGILYALVIGCLALAHATLSLLVIIGVQDGSIGVTPDPHALRQINKTRGMVAAVLTG
ncbi:MAG: hypothetical protein OEV88_17775, partial [Gammaproteobacteria bacterium]|nr:hypothetical protein [Gammaproteobacteria bacterium]